MSDLSAPKLTIVVAARNDTHGGNMLGRMQLFVDGVLWQSQKHKLHTELLIVEWNPPPDRDRLAQALSFSQPSDYCSVRLVSVPLHVHKKFAFWRNLPLYQMIAKNVGIRRARGEYVLVTNIDILFSDKMFAHFASGALAPGRIYRADRYDVPANVPPEAAPDERLEFCRANVMRINNLRGTLNCATNAYYDKDPQMGLDIRNIRKRGHTNGCGDFQMMHRDDWARLKGYAELDMFSFHLDSLLEYAALYAGLEEVRLEDPLRIYHIDHKGGWSPENAVQLDERLRAVRIARLDYYVFLSLVNMMDRRGDFIDFNGPDWGLAEEPFFEITVKEACRDLEPQQA